MREHGINQEKISHNLSEAELIEISLKQNSSNQISADGALVVKTGHFTGRAPLDKYVVVDSYSTDIIDWENNIQKMTKENFNLIKEKLISNFNNNDKPVFITTKSVSAAPEFAMEVNLITQSASHSLFCTNIFREEQLNYPLGSLNIYHDPDFHIEPENYSLRSSTIIAINFSTNEIIIAGTGYAGEIKKSVFSVLNTLLPDYKVLPMHTGANATKNGDVSLFFGLSGTGKTTLSTDADVLLIGDDEHGMSENGIFNFEGGCYAKTAGLKMANEPDIFKAANRFKSLLENVVLDTNTRIPNFEDKSITENGRATYSLKVLDHIEKKSRGSIPTNLFFLSADALGVLPAVSLLSPSQAIYYFLTGYTAKLAGTEIGIRNAEATFSHCFGAPFMMRKPEVYSNLLNKYITENSIKVWLINTGWYGGPYGKGKRYPLDFTRNCIRSIQQNNEITDFITNKTFDLNIPHKLNNVDSHFLVPENLWQNENEYFEAALTLKEKFEKNFQKFSKLN